MPPWVRGLVNVRWAPAANTWRHAPTRGQAASSAASRDDQLGATSPRTFAPFGHPLRHVPPAPADPPTGPLHVLGQPRCPAHDVHLPGGLGGREPPRLDWSLWPRPKCCIWRATSWTAKRPKRAFLGAAEVMRRSGGPGGPEPLDAFASAPRRAFWSLSTAMSICSCHEVEIMALYGSQLREALANMCGAAAGAAATRSQTGSVGLQVSTTPG